MKEKIIQLKNKLETAKITYEEIENTGYCNRIQFIIPAGKEKHNCSILLEETVIDHALSCEFEKFSFLKGYEGIWSQEMGVIETEIASADYSFRLLLRLNNYINKSEKNDKKTTEEVTSIALPSFGAYTIEIGNCSNEFAFLSSSRERAPRSRNLNRITFKIRNCDSKTHVKAVETLEKIANSMFFQIDLLFEIPIHLQVHKNNWIDRHKKRTRKQFFVDDLAMLSNPKYEYDIEPISLYWYAKESGHMPIFQYLAYYQTIEFYFPVYYNLETKQKIQGIIKDPRFNSDKDADIIKIISTIQSKSKGRSFGSEREQLKATIAYCADNESLKEFLSIDPIRNTFFVENKEKKISKQKISTENNNADLVSEVSERIYELRCKIVHSKSSNDEFDVLLPYSPEVNKMNYDIELIEFIARKVLINSSRPLKL